MIYKRPLALAATLLVASLGACSQSNEPPTHGANYTDTRTDPTDDATPTAPATPDPEPAPAPAPAPTPSADTNMTAALPEKAPPPAPDEQLMDDASASGMTARTSRSDQTSQPAPAEPTENK